MSAPALSLSLSRSLHSSSGRKKAALSALKTHSNALKRTQTHSTQPTHSLTHSLSVSQSVSQSVAVWVALWRCRAVAVVVVAVVCVCVCVSLVDIANFEQLTVWQIVRR